MKKEIAEKWVKALRSGKYKQGRAALCSIDKNNKRKYCCLGVLCHILKTPNRISGDYVIYDEVLTYLPNSVKTKAKMFDQAGCTRNANIDLSLFNDHGSSFKEIADVIEKNWKSL